MSNETNVVINLEIRPNTAAIMDGSFDGDTLAQAFDEAQAVIPELIVGAISQAITADREHSPQATFVGKGTITHELTGTEVDVTVTLNVTL